MRIRILTLILSRNLLRKMKINLGRIKKKKELPLIENVKFQEFNIII